MKHVADFQELLGTVSATEVSLWFFFFCLINRSWLRGAAVSVGTPRLDWPSHLLQFIWRNPKALPGQPSDVVSLACLGSPPSGTCPEHLSRQAFRRHPRSLSHLNWSKEFFLLSVTVTKLHTLSMWVTKLLIPSARVTNLHTLSVRGTKLHTLSVIMILFFQSLPRVGA